jgi:hypothetical protein
MMVNQMSLKTHEDVIYHRGDFAYPKASHAKAALTALVTTRPYVSIIEKITETAIDMKKARNALLLC